MRKTFICVLLSLILAAAPLTGAFAAQGSMIIQDLPVTAKEITDSICGDSGAIYRSSTRVNPYDFVATGDILIAPGANPREIIVKGDVKGTGLVDITQLTTLAGALNGTVGLTGPLFTAGDMNYSGTIDIADLIQLAQKLSSQFTRPTLPPITQTNPLATQFRTQVIQETNAYRQRNGENRVLISLPALNASAQARAEEMAATGVFSHDRPDGNGWWTVLQFEAPCAVAENLHMCSGYEDYEVVDTAMAGWLESQSHRDTILNGQYAYIGVGFAQAADGTWYACQHFSSGDEMSAVKDPIIWGGTAQAREAADGPVSEIL